VESLSVVLIAQDEERNIEAVLNAVKDIAAEIVLVDSGSTDATVPIATKCGARVIHQDWLGYAAQKNYALSKASCNWILSLDADEVITAELAAEIKDILSSNEVVNWDGFKIARLMFVGDRAVPHGGFYPDAQLRLFKNGMGKFNDRLVHESIVLDGRIRTLKHHLLHYSYKDLQHFQSSLDKYAKLAAEESKRSGYSKSKTSLLNLWLHPLWTFCWRYVGRAGFLDGALGLQMNLIYSDYVRKKIAYLRESNKA
jgi:glycosyltransferase involved in cell wall biosynthesis